MLTMIAKKIFKLKTKDNTKIRVTRFGIGRPSILFVSGVHGDEKTGPKILSRLIRELGPKKIRGMVDIITVANPRAYRTNQRLHPKDHGDLNRFFPPSNSDTPTGNLANVLGKFAIRHDLVIDLHTFPNQISPIIGVSLPEGSARRQKISNELLEVAQPDLIWLLNTKKTEPQKGGSICSFALKKNRAAFGLELSPNDLVSRSQIIKTIEGLKAVLIKMGAIDHKLLTKPANKISVYERRVYKSRGDGQFTPQKDILTAVEKNEVVGRIKIQQTMRPKRITSPISGILLTISKKRFIKKGEKLFVIGVKTRAFLSKYPR